MYYVYIIQSTKDGSCYTGITTNLKSRILERNTGKVRFTSSRSPYKLKWYCAFPDKIKAYQLEKYFKSGSGFAFAKKHLVQ